MKLLGAKKSIVRPLIVYQSLLVLLVMAVLVYWLPQYVGRVMLGELKATMAESATVIEQLVELEDDDKHDDDDDDELRSADGRGYELEFEVDNFELDGARYALLDSKGTVMVRSSDLPWPTGAVWGMRRDGEFGEVAEREMGVTAEGVGGMQYYCYSFTPRGGSEPWQVWIFADRSAIEQAMEVVREGTIVGGLGLWAFVVVVGAVMVRRGVKPVVELAEVAEKINESRLDTRFEVENMPIEVEVVGEKLNSLLARLDEAFSREKRFSASATHELRTPVAELKAILYVGLKRAGEEEREYFEDCMEVCDRMESLLISLLSLTRRNVEGKLKVGEVAVGGFLRRRLDDLGAEQKVVLEVEEDLVIPADPGLLERLVDNLVSNAVQYGDEGELVKVIGVARGDEVELRVENRCSALEKGDLQKMAEPFWRKDGARTSGVNQGLGLSMVQVYCELMGWELEIGGELPDVVIGIKGTQRGC